MHLMKEENKLDQYLTPLSPMFTFYTTFFGFLVFSGGYKMGILAKDGLKHSC